MLRTIFMIIGILFSLVFMGIMFKTVVDAEKDLEDGGQFLELQATKNGSNLIISWSTDTETDSVLYYHNQGTNAHKRATDFSNTHRIILEGVSGTVEFYIEACDFIGDCIISENRTVSMP